jgi:hypothetical protein
MQQMTGVAVERAMKLQDVMLRAMAKGSPGIRRRSRSPLGALGDSKIRHRI